MLHHLQPIRHHEYYTSHMDDFFRHGNHQTRKKLQPPLGKEAREWVMRVWSLEALLLFVIRGNLHSNGLWMHML